jgi:putative flippase GtrA
MTRRTKGEWMRGVTLGQLMAYAFVMAVGTGLDVLCATVVRGLPGVPLVFAAGAGYVANTVSGYVLSRAVVFRGARNTGRTAGPRYLAVIALNVAVAVVGVTALVDAGAAYLVARLLSTAVLVPLNFLLMRHWVLDAAPIMP